MSVLGMLAWFAAAVSLWLGARRHDGAIARGYRWLAGAAALYCAGLIITQFAGVALNPAPGLSFTDLPPLLALAAAAAGIAVLTTAGRDGDSSVQRLASTRSAHRPEGSAGPDGSEAAAGAGVLPGLADGYVMAIALLVIGWVSLFSAEFHRSGERPGTFLLALVHPLADLSLTKTVNNPTPNVGGTVTYLDADITNTGDKTLVGADMNLVFKNTMNEIVQKETLPLHVLVENQMGGYPDLVDMSRSPITPGHTKSVRMTLEHISADWDQSPPQMGLANLKLR